MTLSTFLRGLEPGTVATVAGVGWKTGGEAAASLAGWPMGVVRTASGELLVADYQGHRIWRIDRDGILHNFAGTGVAGFGGDGGPASRALLSGPHDLWQDPHGNLYFSDLSNYRIRRIDGSSGIITTVAGCGIQGSDGDGGPAVEAQLNVASGVATDLAGNLYTADEYDNTVRRVDTRGIITRFAGIRIPGYNGDGIPASEAALHHPEHLAFDSRGNLYICDNSNDRIRRVDRDGIISTVFGNPRLVQVDGQLSRSSAGDGLPAAEASVLMPDSLFIDRHDHIYVGEKYGFRVRRVDGRTGLVSTVVGTGLPAYGEDGRVGEETRINSCESGLWVDDDGSVLWADCSGRIRRVDGRTRIVTTVLGGTHVGDGGPATEAALTAPRGLAVAKDGTIYVSDLWHHRIRAIDPVTWTIRTVAGTGARFYGGDGGRAIDAHLANPNDVAVDESGNIYIADQRRAHVRRVDRLGVIRSYLGNGFPWDGGDGGSAASCPITSPISLAISPDGDLFVGDGIGRIRRVQHATGTVTTVAGIGLWGYTGDGASATQARITEPSSLTFDDKGNLYFTDSANHCVRRVESTGRITTLAGTGRPGRANSGVKAGQAPLRGPQGVAVDEVGTVYISDTGNHRIVAVRPDGTLEVVAGTGEPGDGGDGGPAPECQFNQPSGLAIVEGGCLLVSDQNNNRIRVVKPGG